MSNNTIYLIVGRSGSGKTTIAEELEKKYGLKSIQSYTTRPKRSENETGHIFISDEEFDNLTDMVAYTEFNNYRYCATTEQVENHDLYIIDPKGIEYFAERYKGNKNIKVIYINVSVSVSLDRMIKRGVVNGKEQIMATAEALKRLTNDSAEFYDYVHGIKIADYTINNNDITLEEATEKIYKYITEGE